MSSSLWGVLFLMIPLAEKLLSAIFLVGGILLLLSLAKMLLWVKYFSLLIYIGGVLVLVVYLSSVGISSPPLKGGSGLVIPLILFLFMILMKSSNSSIESVGSSESGLSSLVKEGSVLYLFSILGVVVVVLCFIGGLLLKTMKPMRGMTNK